MLINVTNHPASAWPTSQKQAAQMAYGPIKDWLFPEVDPNWTTEQVAGLANKWAKKIHTCLEEQKQKTGTNAVLVMGEFTFVYALVQCLHSLGVLCTATTSERRVSVSGNQKVSHYHFVQFRPFVLLHP